MKKHILLLLFFCLPIIAVAQEKYAVLIIGDYADRGVPEQYRWNNGGTKDHRPHEEFWHDTFLMWKMLQSEGFDKDNIYVLFADGNDYASDNPLYQPPVGVTVTNDSATIRKVTDLFEDLRYGSNGRPRLTEDDFLFVWVFDHGKEEGGQLMLFLPTVKPIGCSNAMEEDSPIIFRLAMWCSILLVLATNWPLLLMITQLMVLVLPKTTP